MGPIKWGHFTPFREGSEKGSKLRFQSVMVQLVRSEGLCNRIVSVDSMSPEVVVLSLWSLIRSIQCFFSDLVQTQLWLVQSSCSDVELMQSSQSLDVLTCRDGLWVINVIKCFQLELVVELELIRVREEGETGGGLGNGVGRGRVGGNRVCCGVVGWLERVWLGLRGFGKGGWVERLGAESLCCKVIEMVYCWL